MQHHIIQQQLFDVGYSDAGTAYELQNRISEVFNNQLSEAMEQLFSRLVPPDTVLSMGDVEIDVGNIPYSQLEYQLADRVLFELEKAIRGRLALIPSANGAEQAQNNIETLEGSYTNLLEHFLLTGSLPWWASGEMLTEPVKVMQYLIENDTERLKQLITTVGQHGYVRQRLVQQFSEEIIRSIISILEPAQAAFIFDYHNTVSKKHQEERLVESAPATEFEKALWLFILTYILVDRGSLFNRKMFVSATLGQMAGHYNRAYADILALLSKALVKYNLNDRQGNELLTIISELSADEFDERQTVKTRRSGITQPLDEDVVLQNLEVIKHYLVFGSLPWWSEPYSENNLINLLLELIRVIPLALRKVIVAAGQSDEVRKRITTAFNEEVITGVIKILEPADATFIINYVNEVQEVHVKKPVVYTDGKSFKKAVWKFVFDFLLVERGSEFNRRMFLRSNIRRLADNYNVQYFEMLMYLIQSIGQVHQDNIDQAPLFKLLATLLNDDDNVSTALSGNYERRETFADTVIKRRQVVLKDVLLHWLTYGNIPWWGNVYFEQGPSNMFLSLLAEAPNDAFMLLRYAGTTLQMRKRAIYQLPATLVMDIFAQQTSAFPSVKYYNYLLGAFVKITKTLQLSIPSAGIETALMTMFWDIYAATEYKNFNDSAFIQKAIIYMLTKAGADKQPAIIKSLKKAFEGADISKDDTNMAVKHAASKSKETTGAENIYLKVLEEIAETIVGQGTYIQDVSIAEIINTTGEPVENTDIVTIITTYLATKQPAEQEIAAEVLRILEHFVANQKLPAQFKGTNPAYVAAVIRQLITFLKKTSPSAYKQLLSKSAELKQYTTRQAETEPVVKIDGSIQQLIITYLQKEKQEKRAATSEDVLKEATELLKYFLMHGKLPDALLTTDSINADILLKQLILTLHYAKPNILNDILQHDGYRVEAKMQIHNLFATAFNIAESNIGRVLKEQIEKDIIQYIKAQGAGINPDNKLAIFIEQFLGRDLSKNQQMLSVILKQSPAVARYIARFFSDEQVRRMFNENTSIIGGTESIPWLSDLQTLIADKIMDTLSRDKLNNLIREFNLLALGGHTGVSGFSTYLRELFRFIAAQNQTLFTTLSKVLADAGSAKREVAQGFHEKLSIALAELNVQKTDIKNEQIVKKQLTKANDDALQNISDLNAAKQKSAEEKQIKDELKRRQQQQEDEAKAESKKLLKDHEEPMYIKNAGLILLNPFIPAYFVRTGVMNGGKFVSEDAQHRAVHLLQYLVDTTTNSAEHLLVLNKILCNLPIEEPVPAEIEMTEAEKETAQSLLKAVIGNWEKLKNSSVDALRGSFLIRDGSIIFKEDAWHLKIEQRGYDVLLQTLPWTIGMIKTPWMDKFLYVEWI